MPLAVAVGLYVFDRLAAVLTRQVRLAADFRHAVFAMAGKADLRPLLVCPDFGKFRRGGGANPSHVAKRMKALAVHSAIVVIVRLPRSKVKGIAHPDRNAVGEEDRDPYVEHHHSRRNQPRIAALRGVQAPGPAR